MKRVLVIGKSAAKSIDIEDQLVRSGHIVIGPYASASDYKDKKPKVDPDFVCLIPDSDDRQALELAKSMSKTGSKIIIFSDDRVLASNIDHQRTSATIAPGNLDALIE